MDGFKNLDRIDVRLGPFTCIAGPNGVGKSNLFDAISFLAALAGRPLVEAASTVRGGESRRGDVWGLFRRAGDRVAERMKFAAEFLIPEEGEDELGQAARASMTFLRYELELRCRRDSAVRTIGALEIVREKMAHVNRSAAKTRLGFPHKKRWRDSVFTGRRTSPYISTEMEAGDEAIVSLHADSAAGLGGGRPRRVPAANLPRTMLSSVNNAAEHRTLVLARQEMAGWTQLQLEPSSLRAPDDFTAPRSMGPSGSHLPATLYELAQGAQRDHPGGDRDVKLNNRNCLAGRQAAQRDHPGGDRDVYARVANKLSELVENVRGISVDVDEKRQLLSVVMTDLQNTEHVASALSDGTLRFLALTVMESDPGSRRLICLEEPENGMHPLRISAVVSLLAELAVDVDEPVDADNPLRQVIVNTHSPSVVACVHDDALLVAHAGRGSEPAASRFSIRHLPGTWRDAGSDEPAVSRGDLMAYLNPLRAVSADAAPGVGATRVIHRKQRPDARPAGGRDRDTMAAWPAGSTRPP